MGARTATGEPTANGSEARSRSAPIQVATRLKAALSGLHLRVLPFVLRSQTRLILAIAVVSAAVLFVAGLTYYGAREFSGRATDARASNEAMSFAAHSSHLATGDAFDGYIQILRYADDPILNAKASTPNERADAMQRLLYVNINKFSSLTLVDRAGLIFASTDSTIANVRPSTAFSESRANLAPANTDVILPEAGHHGYVEYSAPLRDPDGTIWGILLGRADPATLWKGTLAATVDGSRNVIINSEGLYAAGVPDDLLRQPWHGRPLGNGGVLANIAGVESICGLAPIGKDTQIDRGLNVASCLPASLIQVERHAATGKQAWITIAGAILAIVIAATLLKVVLSGGPVSPKTGSADTTSTDAPLDSAPPVLLGVLPPASEAPASAVPAQEGEPEQFVASEEGPTESGENPIALEEEPVSDPGVVETPPPDVDALTLIDAYEQRNARLAERLRESVQARLLVAATEAEAAFRLAETDADAAAALHEHAMGEVEEVRVRELRTIGQELYPGLTRLGLAGSLRAMRKAIGEDIHVTLDLDATTDSVGGGASRASVAPGLRLVMYRFALETVRALASSGVERCTVTLRRVDARLSLEVSCGDRRRVGDLVDQDVLAPSALAIEAHGGALVTSSADGVVIFALDVPASELEPGPDIVLDDEDPEPDVEDAEEPIAGASVPEQSPDDDGGTRDDDDNDAEGAAAVALGVTLEPRTGLAGAIEGLQTQFFGSMIVTLDLAPDIESRATGDQAGAIDVAESVVRETLRALEAAQSRQCDVTIRRSGPQVMLTILSEIGSADFDATHIAALAPALEELGGYLSVAAQDGSVAVSAELAYAQGDDSSEPAPPDALVDGDTAHAA